MIIPSKHVLLVAPADAKQIFLFDPKTACILHKYTTDTAMAAVAGYYATGHQFVIPHLNNTYVNIWETDSQEPRKYSVGQAEKVTSIQIYQDSVMFMGTASGALLVYEIPSGVLIRRKPLHSSQIIKMHMLKSGHLITCSRSELKLWPLKDILAEEVKPIPEKSLHSATYIISFVIIRNILCVLSENSLRTFFAQNLSVVSLSQDLPEIKNATCCSHSESQIFIGDAHGKIKQIPIIPHQKQLSYEERRGTSCIKKKVVKELDAKDPLTQLQYIESLELLVSGNCKGQVKIWNKQGIKNSMQLFKTAIGSLHLIEKPEQEQKIPQNFKITALHKQEMTKLECPALVNRQGRSEDSDPIIEPGNEHYLSLMLDYLNDPAEFMQAQLAVLKQENEKMLEANLQYAQLFDHLEE